KNAELWYMSLSDGQTKPFVQGPWLTRTARFSPDGRWVAYSSNETGNWEVYVSAFPNPSSKWQVSRGGGEEPRWRRDGKELFEHLRFDVAAADDGDVPLGPGQFIAVK